MEKSCNGTLHSSKKDWSTTTQDNVDESHRHNAELKKSETKYTFQVWFHYMKSKAGQN